MTPPAAKRRSKLEGNQLCGVLLLNGLAKSVVLLLRLRLGLVVEVVAL